MTVRLPWGCFWHSGRRVGVMSGYTLYMLCMALLLASGVFLRPQLLVLLRQEGGLRRLTCVLSNVALALWTAILTSVSVDKQWWRFRSVPCQPGFWDGKEWLPCAVNCLCYSDQTAKTRTFEPPRFFRRVLPRPGLFLLAFPVSPGGDPYV